jgi:peptidyl-prolyl cis-trans isomerase SurA
MQLLNCAAVRPGRLILWTLFCAGVAAGCGRATEASKAKTPSPDVWATVDGREIRRDDVEKAYRTTIDPAGPKPSDVEALGARLEAIDQLIIQDILLARAKAANIEPSDAEVETAYADRKRSMTDDAFQQQLTQRDLTVDDMKRAVRRELTVQKMIDRDVGSKVAVSDQEISDFYTANRARFNVAETQYHIAQIVITPVRDPQLRNRKNDDATTSAEADRKAQMLLERLQAGTPFSELAMDYSEDPNSAPQGGDLGFVAASALNRVPAPLREAVLQTPPGTVKVVSAGGGHTLLLVLERQAAGVRQLSDPAVRDQIRDSLRQGKEQVLRSAYLAVARNDAKVVNYLAQQTVDAQGKMPSFGLPAPGRKQ